MADAPFDPISLNAYVDCELPPGEAARIARRAAADPRIAKQIATLQELRAGVASMGMQAVVMPPPAAALRRPRRRIARMFAVVATVLVAVAGAAWWWSAHPPRAPHATAPASALAQMIGHYDAWRERDLAPIPPGDAASARMSKLMAATGLALVLKDTLQLDGGASARHTGFLGTNDCRLSLFEVAGARAAPALAFAYDDTLFQASWRSDATHYVLIARDMNSIRFATIADSLQAATRTAERDEDALIASLQSARQRCVS